MTNGDGRRPRTSSRSLFVGGAIAAVAAAAVLFVAVKPGDDQATSEISESSAVTEPESPATTAAPTTTPVPTTETPTTTAPPSEAPAAKLRP